MIDLLDLPFNIIHTLYKNALLTAIAQKEKEEKDAKERAAKEAAERKAEVHAAKQANQRGPRSSSIPIKKQPNSVQMPSQSSNADIARLSDSAMSDFEDLLEEGF